MKVETPQILWHDTHNMSAKDNGKSFPILSCHLIDDSSATVLATAGGCEINLWSVTVLPDEARSSSDGILIAHAPGRTQTQIQHLTTLSRGTNERTVNCLRFSPNKTHLAAVGDGGQVVIYTLPANTPSNCMSWASLQEKQLNMKIIHNQSDDVMDLSWSCDSQRIAICSLDHTVSLFELDGEWKSIYKSTNDHSHYVQGVAVDPKGMYVASMGSDRALKVFCRKVKEEEDLKKKFELAGKCKTVKSWGEGKEKRHLFADELTMGSFFRRLDFTVDGAFLIVPAGLWHGKEKGDEEEPGSPKGVDALSEASFGTYLFARHAFEKPYKVLAGLDKPSVVVRPNPLLFQLPADAYKSQLPHRSIFAVLTIDTVLIYDTVHDEPLAVARGLHYAGLTDAVWSADGMTLFVTSSDGYVSILSFANGELGEPITKVEKEETTEATSQAIETGDLAAAAAAQPAINILAPKKKKKVTLNLEANVTTEIENVRDTAVVNTLVPKKKKKIVPTPVTETSSDAVKRPQEDQVNILVPKKKAKVEDPVAEEVNESPPEKKEEIKTTDSDGVVTILLPKKKVKAVPTAVAESS